jgi:hypothetical protein
MWSRPFSQAKGDGMSSSEFTLGPLPVTDRRRELWVQHAAGFILFEDVRRWAIQRLDPNLDATARLAALKAIDDAVYGLMMVIDGVTGDLGNSEYQVHLRTQVCLARKGSGETIETLDLMKGDGMCVGYHGWLEGDFGEDPVVVSAADGPS